MSQQSYPLTPEQIALLPFDFINATYEPALIPGNIDIYWASWNSRLVYALEPQGPWSFDNPERQITESDWEHYYPGFSQVSITNIGDPLVGTFDNKEVCWSRSKQHWEYLNHRSVTFPTQEEQTFHSPATPLSSLPLEEDDEQEQVSQLLDTALQTTTRIVTSLTPRHSSPATPTQPTPLPSSSKGKAPASTSKPTISLQAPTTQPAPVPPLAPAPVQLPPMAQAAQPATPTRLIGTAPEAFDGSSTKAEAFWSNLETYYYLNTDAFTTEDRRVASALTHFKLGTSAGDWAKDRQQTALAANPITFGTWQEFKDAFKAHFIPADSILHSTNLMHTIKMGPKKFQDWFQDWSTHASRSQANEQTKMYAFWQNIPNALHQKILGVNPAPMTLTRLVKLAKEFDQAYHMWQNNSGSSRSSSTRPRIRTTTADTEAADVNAATTDKKKSRRLTPEERNRRCSEGACMYCGNKGHWQDRCPETRGKPCRPQNFPP
jgi:hypothetical protein